MAVDSGLGGEHVAEGEPQVLELSRDDRQDAEQGGFPVIEAYPRAEHWSEWTYAPGLFPTAGLAGLLHRMGVEHPWLSQATLFCWSALDEGLPDDAHALPRSSCSWYRGLGPPP